jgi:hypothetical protein
MVRQGLRIEVCKCGEYLRVYDADNLLVFDTVFGAARNENTTLNVQFSVSYSSNPNVFAGVTATGISWSTTSGTVPTFSQTHTYWARPSEYKSCPMCDTNFDAFSVYYCRPEKGIPIGMYNKCKSCKYKFFCGTQGYTP